MTLAINTTDAFATGKISNTAIGGTSDKSFATDFKRELILISSKDRIEIDAREAQASTQALYGPHPGPPHGSRPRTYIST